ncbi:MAG: hypothetical protein OK452_02800 [Thaumarchaeota archaeon]|nr:hypothetical protein [Nitrososphaerota archaeon]
MRLERQRIGHAVRTNQWLAPSELRALQVQKLKALLSHAYASVPYHRRRLDERGIRPDSIRSLADLDKVPVMSKQDLRENPLEDLVPKGLKIETCRRAYTSGTTGTPVFVLVDRDAFAWRRAYLERVADALGLDPWEHRATLRFTFPKFDPRGDPANLKLKKWLSRRRNRYSREFFFTYDCLEILYDLLKFKPKVIQGNPAYLMNLTHALKDSMRPSLKMLGSSGDTLDLATRRELESFFGCPLYEAYGSQDLGPMAWQCRNREGLHMNVDGYVFEIVGKDGGLASGESGRLLVTCLDNYAMPVIRYEVGDEVTLDPEPCSCGRGLPLMKRVDGRQSDFLDLPGGKRISPQAFVSCINQVAGLPRFQLVVKTPADLELRLYAQNVSSLLVQESLRRCHELFGRVVSLNVVLVKEEPRAKLRSVIPNPDAQTLGITTSPVT